MRYVKPSITPLRAASEAIQEHGLGKPTIFAVDGPNPKDARTTGSAYDLDE